MIYRFNPVTKTTPWGGHRLCELKGLGSCTQPIGESWELSGIEGMESTVSEGAEKGLTLSELIECHKANLVGKHNYEKHGCQFPLLLKFLDSEQWLSLQVHPDNDTAKRLEGPESNGKHEMWHVIDAYPDSKIILGFKDGISRHEYENAEGTPELLNMVNIIDVCPGMEFSINSGTIHALGPGCLVAEIQQPSDYTYRIYDHGRDRELHLTKAREAIRFSTGEEDTFKVEHCKLEARKTGDITPKDDSFLAVMIIGGECRIEGREYAAGTTLLISADHGSEELEAGKNGVDYLTVAV